MTAEEQELLQDYLVELGQIDPESTPAERAFDFEVWYAQRRGNLLQAHPRRGESVEAGREGRPPAGPYLGYVKAVVGTNNHCRPHQTGLGPGPGQPALKTGSERNTAFQEIGSGNSKGDHRSRRLTGGGAV